MDKKIKWAILSTGRIAHEFTQCLQKHEDSILYAVASRTLRKAEEFKNMYGFEKAYGSYEELVEDPDIDIIYIGTPTTMHYENAKLCLSHKQNVLCEKAVTVNRAQFQVLCDMAKENDVFFMEAMWLPLHPTYIKAKQWIEVGRIGEVQLLKAEHCFEHPYDPTDRGFSKALGAGTILDLGVYCFAFANEMFGSAPDKVNMIGRLGPDGADIDTQVQMLYPTGYAIFTMGYVANTTSNTVIAGPKGKIQYEEIYTGAKHVYLYNEKMEIVETYTEDKDWAGLDYEIESVNECLRKGLKTHPVITWEHTHEMFDIIEVCKEQMGVDYEEYEAL
ncbi:MAG: Gfo/Idh/MocA family oxidoreductase [Clostridia bacterium]|nr:Gfo/Idh/MocA family oxidoreductase [Clostridia bacterium]